MVILHSQDYGPDVGRPSSKKPPRLYCLGFLGWESHFEIRTLLLVASSKKPPMIKNVTLTLSMFNNFLIFCSNCSFSKFSSSVTKTSVNSNLCSSLNFFWFLEWARNVWCSSSLQKDRKAAITRTIIHEPNVLTLFAKFMRICSKDKILLKTVSVTICNRYNFYLCYRTSNYEILIFGQQMTRHLATTRHLKIIKD